MRGREATSHLLLLQQLVHELGVAAVDTSFAQIVVAVQPR